MVDTDHVASEKAVTHRISGNLKCFYQSKKADQNDFLIIVADWPQFANENAVSNSF